MQSLTHLRILVNIAVGLMLGSVFFQTGMDAGRVLDNYNLLFSILIHHMMTTMMLTVVTCKNLTIFTVSFYFIEPTRILSYRKHIICIFLSVPMQMNILLKEHFNRWYSLKAFYTAMTLVDLPLTIFCCLIFTLIVYFVTFQPLEPIRFLMFLSISVLVALIGQGTGLMIDHRLPFS